ncbi:hypothetical protein EI977_15085 [Bacillus paralicheniformis]|nr:hypothetical protein EI977_15085 [Bacillus paralicheniformis]KAA0843123.1 hypothetical protein EI979_03450 [Bacillus paralicheniformis]
MLHEPVKQIHRDHSEKRVVRFEGQGATETLDCRWLKYGADGSYGDETVQAVKALQKKAGIVVDGIYGPATERRL